MDFVNSKDAAPTRRKFLSKAAAATAGTAALGFPMVSKAQTTTFRFQSTWPSKDIFHEYATDFAKKVNDMAGGRQSTQGRESAERWRLRRSAAKSYGRRTRRTRRRR